MRSFYLNTIPGATTLSDPQIAATLILNVKREGVGFNEVVSSPGSRDFVYNPTGTLSFNSLTPFNSGEKVFVLCL